MGFRMRKGWRKVAAGLGLFLLGTIAPAAPPDPAPGGSAPVRLTVEVTWTAPPGSDPAALDLEISEGRVVEALAWPAATPGGPEPRPGGWVLGTGRTGRVRARIEAPLGASLAFLTNGQVMRIPIQAILEGPQRTPATAALEIGVERLSWDSLEVGLGQGDGTAAPGSVVPVSVGFNVLAPETTEVSVRCTVELRSIRGGEPVWRHEQSEVVAANVANPAPATLSWELPAPAIEGTYILDVRATWEPVASSDSTRIGRWIRRRRIPASASSASRRLTLTVVGPQTRPVDDPAAPARAESEVESIDLARLRGFRPTASGRAPVLAAGDVAWTVPEAALVEATRRDRLGGWISRAGSEAANLAPADASGLAWSALGLKVPHPGRPHRLSLTVTGGHPSSLGVAMVDPGTPKGRPRIVLDACASGPPILEAGPPATFSWLVWPDAADPVLVLVNRDTAAPVRLGTVTLAELPDVPPPTPPTEPAPDPSRSLGLYLAGPSALDRFGGGAEDGRTDPMAQARNLSQYAAYCGATTVVLPEAFADRLRRRALEGQAAEDATGPDRLDLLCRILKRQGCSSWLELTFEGPLPGLPAPDSPDALGRGLVRLDRRGQADGPAYHPLHPEVREALTRRVAEALASRPSGSRPSGLLIRLGPGPTLLGGPDTGLDDDTFTRFVRETFGPETTRGIPGLDLDDPDRFAARSQFLAGSGRMPWLTWRSRGIAALYSGLADAARRADPGVVLAVATPGLDNGPAGLEARRVDLAGLAPIHAWRSVGLDLETWPSGDGTPVVLRGVGLSADDLGHDLATSPELDAPIAARPGRGLLIATSEPSNLKSQISNVKFQKDTGLRLTAPPLADGSAGDELLGHSLAALDARWVVLASAAVAGHEERVRRFARVLRGLPAMPTAATTVAREPFGVVVRTLPSGTRTYLALANDTPYPIRLDALLTASGAPMIDDLGRGLRLTPETVAGGSRLGLELLPFGVAALRVGSTGVRVASVTPHPSDAVLADMQARSNELANQLSRLGRDLAAGRVGPQNPGFEPASTSPVPIAGAPAVPAGWQGVGGMGNEVEIDPAHPHTGRASLHLGARTPPAAILSEGFAPNAQSSLTVQAWFRSDRPGAKARVWIEGQAAGKPFIRQSELAVAIDWTAMAVRASELPPGGLDSVRLRFELLTAGNLWLDDVIVTGDMPTEPERMNARRALMAAQQAYRERRYADFARLAGSRWARLPGIMGPAPADGPAAHADMIRTGDATALPPASRRR